MEMIYIKFHSEIPKHYTGMACINSDIIISLKNGFYHCETGPAIIMRDGRRVWMLEGKIVSPMEIFDKLSEEEKMKAIFNLDEWK